MFSIEALAERNAARMLKPKYFIFTTLDLLRPPKSVVTLDVFFWGGVRFQGHIGIVHVIFIIIYIYIHMIIVT